MQSFILLTKHDSDSDMYAKRLGWMMIGKGLCTSPAD